MREIDTSNSPGLAVLIDMLSEVSRAESPNDAVAAFASRYWKFRHIDLLFAASTRNLPEGQYKITRRFRVVPGPNGPVQQRDEGNPWRDWNSIPTHEGGFIGSVIAEGRPQLFHDIDLRSDPVIGEDLRKGAHMRSVIAVPTFDRGRTLNWTFQFKPEPDGLTPDDLEMAVLIGNLFGSMTRGLVALEDNRRLTRRLNKQFEEVARVQQALLPKTLPDLPGIKFATSYLTSEQAGGDYYDFFPLADGKLGIVVADVSGHGPGAATVMAMLHAMLHAYPADSHEVTPAAVMRWANERLVEAALDGSFVTAFVGLLDPRTKALTFANAGHPPPRLKDRRTGLVRSLDGESSFPLGITLDMEIPNNRAQLEPGQTLVLYTDGITEAFNSRQEMFGIEGLDAALVKCSGMADCVVDSVHAGLFAHTNSVSRADDQTLLVMELTDQSA
ncbi:MAG: SpoIIE family protein phosphatase [Phycisphaeraceae bacterium]|nr:SpoIIE family protein phosphatase [Phycisphaeraceae bacterium]